MSARTLEPDPDHTGVGIGVTVLPLLISIVFAQNTMELPQTQSSPIILVEAQTLKLSTDLQNTSTGKSSSEESLWEVPNLNTAGGTNRTRYLQIRGLGETSVYETTPSHSVGFFIEDIDVTGLLAHWPQQNIKNFHLQAGPQSIEHGGFSSAGVILIDLNDEDHRDLQVATSSAKELQVGLQTPVFTRSDFFLAHRQSDGFFENAFTNKPGSTQNEISSSLRQIWKTSTTTKISSTHIFQNNQNLYDVWNINNSYVTQSDRQGEDKLTLHGHVLHVDQNLSQYLSLVSVSSWTHSLSVYSYDSDWGHSSDYDYFDRQARSRNQWHQKFFLHTAWGNFGTHFSGLEENSEIQNFKLGSVKNALSGRFSNLNAALILQKEWLFQQSHLKVSARQEWQSLKYSDSNQIRQSQSPQAQAASIKWSYPLMENLKTSLRWTQGYKNSGFNIDPDMNLQELAYGLEKNRSYEWELSLPHQKLTLFYQTQNNVQLKISQQPDPNDPSTFFYRTTNQDETDGWGIEYSSLWPYSRGSIEAQVGLLRTQFRQYNFENTSYRGRDLAHAPRWNFASSAKYDWSQKWSSVISLNGRDGFYYSNNHQQRSSQTFLMHLGLLHQHQGWDLAVWIKNIANARTTVRGFYFANEPPDWPTKLYEHRGPPRHFMMTANYHF